MFRQINVHPDDWDLQRILWFNNNKEITPYHLTTVTYGTRSAPFLAVRVLQQLMEDEGKNYPLAVPALKYGRYVDDIFRGADNTSELKAIANQLKQICTAGSFPLAKWQSNSEEVLNFISPAGACNEPHQLGDCTSKLLGLYWHAKSDNLRFIMKSHSDNQNKSSIRTILSEVAQIFDPLGFLSPLTIKAKMLLQKLWLQKIGWDHQVPSKVLQSWQSLQLELQQIDTLNIPRWINTSKATNCEFHGFCDASQLAMAAAIYVTVHSASGETLTTLLCAKTKVAPLKRLTIPRLELSAALLLSKLITYVKATLQVDAQSTTLWTDSIVTLTWIRSHASRWKDYVRNRVVNIQQLTTDCNWRAIDTLKRIPGSSLAAPLTPTDIERATIYWAKSTQAAYFSLELHQLKADRALPANHPFHRLTAFIDEHGVLLVGGRLANSTFTYNQFNHSAKTLYTHIISHLQRTPPYYAQWHSTNDGRSSTIILDCWWKTSNQSTHTTLYEMRSPQG
ncbi:uncharacterized protein LOC125777528 [Bactrocera dorsalis]|uniref:Uncharacterized protein LOC125777528 n=1 Tax=Bactrocera dorsalis TaxID=27457 RepID=A0ABM3JH88_BACDO|nr:uncharacterized protein LOC125777528 [Bactrocera dorsalis]